MNKEKKSWSDYVDEPIPQHWQLTYAANTLAMLKVLGELQSVEWKLIIVLWVAGLVWRIAKAFFKQAADSNAQSRQNVPARGTQ